MRRESHQAAGVVLYREEAGERAYLLLRSRLTRTPMWEFPKGGVEAGESEEEAAQRELREETGLGADEFHLRPGFREEERYFFTLGPPDARVLVMKRVTYFLAHGLTDRVRISHEASDYRWLPYAEARRLLKFRAKQDVLDRADAWLTDGGRRGDGA